MAVVFDPSMFAQIGQEVFNSVLNMKDPLKVDRKKMPLLAYLRKKEVDAPTAGNLGPQVIYKNTLNNKGQGWHGRQILAFNSVQFDMQTTFPWANYHYGLELTHDDVEAKGFVVIPNAQRGKNFAKSDSKSDKFKKIDFMSETIESMMDDYDVNEDLVLHTDNSSDAELPQGLEAFLPLGVTGGMTTGSGATGGTYGYYNAGSIGGLSRSAYPNQLQHFVWVNATYGADNSARTSLNRCLNESQVRSRGRAKKGIEFMIAGRGWIERYIASATSVGTTYNNAVTVLKDGGLGHLDIAIPDEAIHFHGIPILHDPTLDQLDILFPGQTYAYTNRCYGIDRGGFELGVAGGKVRLFSAPLDPSDQRIIRLSIDTKEVLLPKAPNSCFVHHFAA